MEKGIEWRRDTDPRDKKDNDWEEEKIKTELVRAVVKIGRMASWSEVLDRKIVLELYIGFLFLFE